MKSWNAVFVVAVALTVWVAGCEVSDPGTPMGNTAPNTILSVAPRDTTRTEAGVPDTAVVDHNVAFRWAGNDPDGDVVGFRLYIDGAFFIYTTATDTVIAFSTLGDSVKTPHTFEVAAVDNGGLEDPSPEHRLFNVYNVAPVVMFTPYPVNFVNDAIVGQGFKVTLEASDLNRAVIRFAISLDDTESWTAWSADSVFVYCAPGVLADVDLLPSGTVAISNAELTVGPHVLYARAKDGGEAVSVLDTLSFVVVSDTTTVPEMDPEVVAAYGSSDLYADGSVYYSATFGLETKITVTADASLYSGLINAYRYQMGDGPWSEWQASGEVDTSDLSPGEYVFRFNARDVAGQLSDTIIYQVRIVEQQLNADILVVDETRDGNGNRQSPTDAQVDDFYTYILLDYPVAGTIDYKTHQVNGVSYLSAYDVHTTGVIVYHCDDNSDRHLSENLTLLRQFLSYGGRLILSGWDLMASFTAATDTVKYAESIGGSVTVNQTFPYNYLRCITGYRTRTVSTLGFEGVAPYPTCLFDSTKLRSAAAGLDRCWAFQPRGECSVIGRMVGSSTVTNPHVGLPTAYLYKESFRVAVFGVPLYYCQQDTVRELMNVLMPTMTEGLGSGF